VDQTTLEKIMHAAFPCRQTLSLTPGNYMLRLGVIDQLSKHIGALTAWITIPGASDTAAKMAPAAPHQPGNE